MNNMGIYNPGPKKNIKIIALSVICIVLAASLIGVLALYLSGGNTAGLETQISEKDKTISSLQSQITSLQAQISQTPNSTVNQDQIASLNEQISTLNDQLSAYYNIAMMNASSILLQQPITQDANTVTQVFSNEIYYAGFVTIEVTASDNTTFAEVKYSYAGSDFSYDKTLGTSGTAVFPVLPGTLTINIGNTNQETAPNSVTALVMYYY
ncbi:MAG: hypothetical protein ACM3UN_05750 [Bacillota bacterium]